jgi:hypothetical protein
MSRPIAWLAALWICSTAPSVFAAQHVVVVLDDSGSMATAMRSNWRVTRMEAAKQALRVVLDEVPEDAQVGVVTLNSGQGRDSWIIPLGPVDKRQLNQSIERIQAQGGTPLGEYLKVGADALLDLRARQHYGTYRLVVVTDGEANDPEYVERYLPEILARGIIVDVIGVDMPRSHSLATQVHTYRRADDPESVTQAISAALAESSADTDTDAGVSDFELLAGLPDEVATAALTALEQSGDEPIGESPLADDASGGGSFTRRGSPPGGRPSILGLGLGFVCLVSMLVVTAGAIAALKLASRSK